MRKTLLLIACAVCLVLCACTPHKSEVPESTPAATEPMPTPGMTIIAPSETPVEIIVPVQSEDDPVKVPVDSSGSAADVTPEPSAESSPDDSEDDPVPAPPVVPDTSSGGIDLPYIPV